MILELDTVGNKTLVGRVKIPLHSLSFGNVWKGKAVGNYNVLFAEHSK